MSITTNSKKDLFTPSKEVLEIKDKTIKVIISKRLQSMITYAHHVVGNIEWSGMLLFKEQSGSLAEKELVLFCDYVHILDVGTSGYTEYKVDESILDMYDEFPDAMDYKVAQIHTHHSMSAFFSGTDMSELQDNANKFPYYLSLIVNHVNKPCAKVAWVATKPDSTIKTTWGNYTIKGGEYLCTVDCKVEYEVDETLAKRLAELSKPKFTATKPEYSGYGGYNFKHTKEWESFGGKKKEKNLDDFFKELDARSEREQLKMFEEEAPIKFSKVTVEDFANKLIAQDITASGSIFKTIYSLNKKYTEEQDIEMYSVKVDESISEMFEAEFGYMPKANELNVLCKEIVGILDDFTHYKLIDAILDKISVEYVEEDMFFKKL